MNQRTAGGLTLLDCAKSAAEHFVKVRQRDSAAKGDTYMLVTCEDGPGGVQALDRHPYANFTSVLKSMTASDMSILGPAIKRALDVLNLQKLAVASDQYGEGYCPQHLEPAMLVLLTDGTELTSLDGVAEGLSLPMGQTLGSELTVQPFRWDQRLYTAFMRMPAVMAAGVSASAHANSGAAAMTEVPGADHPIASMCEVTGGRCYTVGSLRALLQCMESLVQRAAPAAVASFDRMTPPGPEAATLPALSEATFAACQHRSLSIRPSNMLGRWPIPEAFRPEPTMTVLPARQAQPCISYLPVDVEPYVPSGFPVDVFEVEACPILGFMMSGTRKGAPDSFAWQVYMQNSKGDSGPGDPFGFLRLKRGGTALALHLLPYNYPTLFRLLEQFQAMPPGGKRNPAPQWRTELERYFAGVPAYYYAQLKWTLSKFGIPVQLMADVRDGGLSFAVTSYLKRLQQQAKQELERLAASCAQLAAGSRPRLGSLPHRQGWQSKAGAAAGSKAAGRGLEAAAGPCRSAFDIPRRSLLEHVAQMTGDLRAVLASLSGTQRAQSRAAGRLSTAEDVAKHSVPVASMGDYLEAAAKHAPLRDAFMDDEERIRQQRIAFGNPYKRLNSPGGSALADVNLGLDEANEAQALDIGFGLNGRPQVQRRRRSASPAREAQQATSVSRASGPDQPKGKAAGPAWINAIPPTKPINVEDAALADAKWAAMMKQQNPAKRKHVLPAKPAKRAKLAAVQAAAAKPGSAPTPPATAATAAANAVTGPKAGQPLGGAAPADIPFPGPDPAEPGAVQRASAGKPAEPSVKDSAEGPAEPSTAAAGLAAGAAQGARIISAESPARKRARLRRMPSEADMERLLQPLRLLRQHREGVVDTSQQLLAALQQSDFPGDPVAWACDLAHLAAQQHKPALVQILAG
ncbi:hypothetical protein WJX72_007615 [[Myrmecia] bisecta]|uniref:Integrator complex subunit 6-like beta-barrel domain-containing protein n=1 Tax=[Myrmecia] bisecta TaxID=41462 RepID=A0AAW1QG56_9CHLO